MNVQWEVPNSGKIGEICPSELLLALFFFTWREWSVASACNWPSASGSLSLSSADADEAGEFASLQKTSKDFAFSHWPTLLPRFEGGKTEEVAKAEE
jgi:hypothetical protein